MSANPYYSYSGAFIPGVLARAETNAAEFQAVQAGFSLLVTEGVDSGVASAYVVTTSGQPTGAYADGSTVEFKPLFAPTGSATINVNGVGVVPLLRFNGSATQVGDFSANQWITATYNSIYSGFTIASPSAVVVYPGTISGAAPTHKVGLVAAGGVSTAAAPIDVTFAIDQSIVPTWTGAHTFSALVTANLGLTVSGAVLTASDGIVVSGGANNFAVNSSGDVVISASSGTALTITGAGGVGSKVFQFNAGGSSVYGLMDTTNVAGAYIGLSISGTLDGIIGMGAVAITGAALADLCLTPNTGVLRLGYNNGAATALSINNTGTVVVAAPTSGVALTINGTSAQIVVFNGSAANTYCDYNRSATLIGRIGSADSVVVSGATTDFGISAPDGGLNIATGGSSTSRVTISSTGNVVVNAPSSGAALTTASSIAAQPALVAQGVATTSAGLIQFYDTTNSLLRGYMGGGATVTGQAVGDISLASVSGNVIVGRAGGNAIGTTFGPNGNVTIAAPSSGVALALTGFAGSSALTIATTGMQVGSPTGGDEGAGTINVASGYYINGTNVLTIVQNSQAEPYTCVLADLGKSVYCTTNGGTVTIPANSSVAYPLGAAITFVAASGVTLTIAITTDTLTLAGTSTTGSRTLAANGVATALKVTSTSWIIGGSGLT